MMRDPEVRPVRIRAFGTYAFHVSDPKIFLQQLVVTDPSFESYEISNQLRDTIVSRFSDVIGTARIPILDLAGNYDRISKLALETIRPDLQTLGLALTFFYIENISVPPEVEQALDTRSKMGVLGDLTGYALYQSATAIGDAAKNPGGAAGAGVGIGAGIALGQQMTAVAEMLLAAMGAWEPVVEPPILSMVRLVRRLSLAAAEAESGAFWTASEEAAVAVLTSKQAT